MKNLFNYTADLQSSWWLDQNFQLCEKCGTPAWNIHVCISKNLNASERFSMIQLLRDRENIKSTFNRYWSERHSYKLTRNLRDKDVEENVIYTSDKWSLEYGNAETLRYNKRNPGDCRSRYHIWALFFAVRNIWFVPRWIVTGKIEIKCGIFWEQRTLCWK